MAAANEEIGDEIPVLIKLYRSTGMSWNRIAGHFGINRRELYRIRAELPAETTFSVTLTDAELKAEIESIKAENPHFGEVYVKAALLSRGFKIPRQRIRNIVREIDPEGLIERALKPKIPRGVYWVPGAMYVWHTDGNEKLSMFGFYIHGCVDGHSRFPIYMRIANNKKSCTTLKMFYEAALEYGLPRFIRMDSGGENIKYAEFMERNGEAMGRDRSVFEGPSTKNVRIERFWGEINDVTRPFKDLFYIMQNDGILNTADPYHLFALHYIYIPRLQKALDNFINIHKVHGLSTESGFSPSEIFLTERYGTFDPVLVHPDFAPIDLEEERMYLENCQFAQNVIPNTLAEDGNFGRNLYLHLLHAIQDATAQ